MTTNFNSGRVMNINDIINDALEGEEELTSHEFSVLTKRPAFKNKPKNQFTHEQADRKFKKKFSKY